jgi:hypothetical protein
MQTHVKRGRMKIKKKEFRARNKRCGGKCDRILN